MKTLKYILSTILIITLVWSCEEDAYGDTDFVNSITAPANISSAVSVTQDNTGLVTITPLGDGVATYTITPGDGSASTEGIIPGNRLEHVYEEGVYDATITAVGLNGLTTSITQNVVVSFKAPENLVVTIENDAAISKQVNVTATADYATSFAAYFGEPGKDDPVNFNIDEAISYQYTNAGTYTIRIVAMSAAIQTTEYVVEFEVTAILQPLESAPSPFSSQNDVISIFSDVYTDIADTDFFPNWGQSTVYTPFELNGDAMIQYSNLNYEGINIGSPVDATSMETLHIDIWSAEDLSIDIYPLPGGVAPEDERFVTKQLLANQWNSFDIPLTDFSDQGLPLENLMQFKFVGTPSGGLIFIDNLYFWKTASGPSPIEGTWMIAPENGAIAVGPAPDDLSWWFLGQFGDDVTTRACWIDDEYVFNGDGTFMNVLGADTWLEPWQGANPETCGTPIAPHDGTNPATWSSTDTTVTVTGLGAYLGIPKVHNSGEDGAPVGNTITYDYVLSDGGNTMELRIVGYGGTGGTETWYFKMIKKESSSPLEGTWKIAPENGAIAVGPAPDDLSWWFLGQFGDDVTTRACWIDDEYVFNGDGTFMNVLGADTWLEPWQGANPETCGTPIAPHDGTNPATWSSTDTTVTVSGLGAYLGIPKVHNSGEDGAPVGNTITYDYVLSDGGSTMELRIVGYGGTGGTETWYFKMVKQ
ncbi:MAG: hypothetical protein ABJM36_07270 [Algibacter sp.]|uniref:hypothetical protein n=1 Tax=Algibacter sp. TaxID=1872428 RepID=UPI003296CA78